MLKLLRNKKGFTLIELMVVAVIVAILAAVAIPLMTGNKDRAMATEGVALCGSIRTGERIYYAENKEYTGTWADLRVDTAGNKYFTTDGVLSSTDSYAAAFVVTVAGAAAGDASHIKVSIDQDGLIQWSTDSGTSWTNY